MLTALSGSSALQCSAGVGSQLAAPHHYTLRVNADTRKSAVACILWREWGVTAFVETDTQQRLGVRRSDEQLVGRSAADTDVGWQRTRGQCDAGGALTGSPVADHSPTRLNDTVFGIRRDDPDVGLQR